MSTITAIEALARTPSRVRVFVDGAPCDTVHSAAVVECGLRKGDAAETGVLDALRAADERHRAYDSALRLLSYRPRAEGEIRTRLRSKGVADLAIANVVDRLKRAGFIDDDAFARMWVRERTAGAGARGAAMLRAELRAKGVANETIAGALDDSGDERERALAVARSRLARLGGLDYPDFSRRLAGFLGRRGFRHDAIGGVVRELWREQRGSDEAPDLSEAE